MDRLSDALREFHARSVDNALDLMVKGMNVEPTGIVKMENGEVEMFGWHDLPKTIRSATSKVMSVTLIVDTYSRSFPDGVEPPDDIDLEAAFLAGDSQVVEAVAVQTVAVDGTYALTSQPYGRVPDVHMLDGHVERVMHVSDVDSFNPFLLAVAVAMRKA